MLAELKDLGEKGLFSSSEIKHILKKRTAFEMALVRRIPNKNDYSGANAPCASVRPSTPPNQ